MQTIKKENKTLKVAIGVYILYKRLLHWGILMMTDI